MTKNQKGFENLFVHCQKYDRICFAKKRNKGKKSHSLKKWNSLFSKFKKQKGIENFFVHLQVGFTIYLMFKNFKAKNINQFLPIIWSKNVNFHAKG